MQPSANGLGGSFISTATFKLDNMPFTFNNISVKIDTGCSISVVPLAKIIIQREILDQLKDYDIRNNISSIVSYGVETGSNRPRRPESYEEKMASSALKFEHSVYGFTVAGVPVDIKTIHVNYDRTGNILIGMDILKDWDIHIRTIRNKNLEEYGETIFLGCPMEQINNQYLIELERIFGISMSVK